MRTLIRLVRTLILLLVLALLAGAWWWLQDEALRPLRWPATARTRV